MEELVAIFLILEAIGIVKVHGKGLIKAAARIYVAFAHKTEQTIEPIKETWQGALVEARDEYAERVANENGRSKATVKANEKRGEAKIKKGAKATAETAVGAAGEAAIGV